MRILADENIPRTVIRALAEAGYDIQTALEREPGASDKQLAAIAEQEARILLTFDKDFGRLALHDELPTSGVVLLRFIPRDPDEAAALVLAALSSRDDWQGHVSVVGRERIRMRIVRPSRLVRGQSRRSR